jgi:hypothetical protein
VNTNYVVVGVAAIVIGALFAGVALTHIEPLQDDVDSAEAVDAVVVSSRVVETTDAENQRRYHPNVTYRYTYDGTEYTASSVFPGDVSLVDSRERAREIVGDYQPGDEVTAYVNADDPGRAFLIERDSPLWFWAGPVIGVLMMLYGVNSIRHGLRGVEQSDFG